MNHTESEKVSNDESPYKLGESSEKNESGMVSHDESCGKRKISIVQYVMGS